MEVIIVIKYYVNDEKCDEKCDEEYDEKYDEEYEEYGSSG